MCLLTPFINFRYFIGFDSWWDPLKGYARNKKNITRWQDFSNPEDFSMILSDFLFSKGGVSYKNKFRFDGQLICNQPAPPITVSLTF